jgi:hypothetical protein
MGDENGWDCKKRRPKALLIQPQNGGFQDCFGNEKAALAEAGFSIS